MIQFNRRDFIKSTALAGIASPLTTSPMVKSIILPEDKITVKPSVAQQSWMNLKFGMFIHFGINTYYDVEWSDGTLGPVKFNPEKMNTDQWPMDY